MQRSYNLVLLSYVTQWWVLCPCLDHVGLLELDMQLSSLEPSSLSYTLVPCSLQHCPNTPPRERGDWQAHLEWTVYRDIHEHPDQRLTSCVPLWSDLEPHDLWSQWRESCETAFVINSSLVQLDSIWFRLFNWYLLNMFHIGPLGTQSLIDDDRSQWDAVW